MDPIETRPRRRFNVRRFIGVLIILAVLGSLVWLLLFSGVAEPVVMTVSSLYNSTASMINDPLGIDWGGKLLAVGMVVLPVVVLVLFLFDDRL